MKWFRRNTKVTKRRFGSYSRNPETGRLEYRPPGDLDKPYRVYSKWHIAYGRSVFSDGRMVISLCRRLYVLYEECEVREGMPGARSALCSDCSMVWKAIAA